MEYAIAGAAQGLLSMRTSSRTFDSVYLCRLGRNKLGRIGPKRDPCHCATCPCNRAARWAQEDTTATPDQDVHVVAPRERCLRSCSSHSAQFVACNNAAKSVLGDCFGNKPVLITFGGGSRHHSGPLLAPGRTLRVRGVRCWDGGAE